MVQMDEQHLATKECACGCGEPAAPGSQYAEPQATHRQRAARRRRRGTTPHLLLVSEEGEPLEHAELVLEVQLLASRLGELTRPLAERWAELQPEAVDARVAAAEAAALAAEARAATALARASEAERVSEAAVDAQQAAEE